MKSWKYIIIPGIFLVAIVLAWYTGYKSSFFQKKTEENSTVLLNRIEKVVKLVAVEGHISEVYSYKDYYGYDVGLFRKKALIRVNAKASVGYDFEKLKINIDSDKRTIEILDFPLPEVLSLDHELDYYDLSQGTFNSFTPEDYTDINKRAKNYVKQIAEQGELIESAAEQKDELLSMMSLLLDGMGWKLVLKDEVGLLN